MFICVLCALLFALPFDSSASTFKPCLTPDGDLGACIGIAHCDRVNKLYQTTEDLKHQEIDFLRLSQESCSSKYLVCCRVANRTIGDDLINAVRAKRSPPAAVEPEPLEEFPFPENCGKQSDIDRIFNGKVAGLDEFPWMALLKYQTEQGVGYACAGALISKRYVLTAAHCVVGHFGPPVEVTLGEYDVNSSKDCVTRDGYLDCADPPQMIAIEEVIKHPEYVKDGNKLHDIALLRLANGCHYNDFVKPICIPTEFEYKNIINSSTMLDVAGWGRTKLRRKGSNVKIKAHLPFVDRETCSANRTMKVAESQICAGGLKQDTCTGDSGGPLMGICTNENGDLHWYVVGIVSYGPKDCGTPGIASVYTNVLSYRDWIIKSMRP